MAERRAFAKSVVLSDGFQVLSMEAQILYFYLGICARDKGILLNAVSITKMLGLDSDVLQELVYSGFLTMNEDEEGYYFTIIHWYENNGIGETARKRNNYPYRVWRQHIIDRDKVCQRCGSGECLEVHHIKRFSEYPELRQDDSNAVVLCKRCHRELHRRERDAKRMDKYTQTTSGLLDME